MIDKYFRSQFLNSELDGWCHQIRISQIRRLEESAFVIKSHFPLDSKINVADVGSSIGDLIRIVCGIFKNAKLFAFEHSVEAVNYLNNHLPAGCVNAQQLTLPDLSKLHRYDVVFMLEVLTYVEDSEFIKLLPEMCNKLNPSGLLVASFSSDVQNDSKRNALINFSDAEILQVKVLRYQLYIYFFERIILRIFRYIQVRPKLHRNWFFSFVRNCMLFALGNLFLFKFFNYIGLFLPDKLSVSHYVYVLKMK